jgi:YD repeat-containing protein
VVDPSTDNASPSTQTTVGEGTSGDASGGARPVDELGRLLTGPGLCAIGGGPNSLGQWEASVRLTYDAQGRPENATTKFLPNCVRHEPPEMVGVGMSRRRCFEDIETQTLDWTWDADGNLLAIEHSVSLELGDDSWAIDPDSPGARDEVALGSRQCLLDDAVLVIERNQWRYDAEGRVIGWTHTYADCDGAETIEETLQYGRGFIDVTHVAPNRTSETRFELDGRGHVAAAGAVRYRYDQIGRLVTTTLADGTSRSWDYDAPLVAEHDQRWTQLVSADGRTITLDDVTADERVVIVLDPASRPEEISFGDESWGLTYEGCPNANRASTRWLVHAIFDAWPFPEEPQAGEALEQREAWTRLELPLRPF